MADAGNKWYVLKAVSGKEAKVKEYIEAEMKHNDLLAANVSQVLIPVEKHATVRNGKRVVKEKVSLPGYVFVEAKLKGDVAHTLRFLPNVLGFLEVWMNQRQFHSAISIVCWVLQRRLSLRRILIVLTWLMIPLRLWKVHSVVSAESLKRLMLKSIS